MNKKELVTTVREELMLKGKRFSQEDINDVLTQIFKEIQISLKKAEPVHLNKFGSFKTKKYKARTCYSPKVGEYVELPERVRPIFVASPNLSEILNEQ